MNPIGRGHGNVHGVSLRGCRHGVRVDQPFGQFLRFRTHVERPQRIEQGEPGANGIWVASAGLLRTSAETTRSNLCDAVIHQSRVLCCRPATTTSRAGRAAK